MRVRRSRLGWPDGGNKSSGLLRLALSSLLSSLDSAHQQCLIERHFLGLLQVREWVEQWIRVSVCICVCVSVCAHVCVCEQQCVHVHLYACMLVCVCFRQADSPCLVVFDYGSVPLQLTFVFAISQTLGLWEGWQCCLSQHCGIPPQPAALCYVRAADTHKMFHCVDISLTSTDKRKHCFFMMLTRPLRFLSGIVQRIQTAKFSLRLFLWAGTDENKFPRIQLGCIGFGNVYSDLNHTKE